ncbi:hypothetical protein JTE90_012656 [Oedothorax gibbosus]|uniref:Eukaryotic translation initiation factor 4E transporter n=1 Tax=Oedothorax gibbosus TaxID=931172 RepID=A0AAV6U2Z9_9ARAC|nr:hypothetical protein JTE90_012656 [Oedothorax gibbosus]
MDMVRQLTEGEIINGSSPEEEHPSSEAIDEGPNSRPPSRSSSGSRRHTPVMPSLQYSKDDLMKYSTTGLSKSWPSCLDPAFNNPTGKWDPERWFMGNRNDRVPPLEDSRPKRDRTDEGLVSHSKRKSSDPKERIKEEKDDIVLSPQRRSFGTGCHVIPQSSLARRPGSPIDREPDSYGREPSRRIGSGRLMRDQRDWEQEYGYNNSRGDRRDRFNQDDSDKDMRRYSNSRYNRNDRRSNRNRIDEVEPEWFSGGPTSQSETIELVGFEDPQNDGEGRKKKKRSKQTSRRSSLKSDEGDKPEPVSSDDKEKSSQKKAESKADDSKKIISEVKETDDPHEAKPASSFDLEELFKMDWIPGLIPNEAPIETTNKDMGCSRFSQWFRKDSPLHDIPGSDNNSRRSSLHEELVANVLNSIAEPQVSIPSPIPNTSGNYFAPISPALSQSSGYALPQTSHNTSKDIMELLQSANSNSEVNERHAPKESMRTVRELEADLKRIVLGNDKKKPPEEKSAFDKLLQHMSDSPQTASLSMGPLDKSKVLSEKDLLQDMLSGPPRRSPMQQSFHMFDEKHPLFKVPSGIPSQFPQQNQHQQQQNSQNDAFANLIHQKQQEQHLQQMQEQQMRMQQMKQQQMQHNHQHQQNPQQQGFTVDMLAKLLCPPTTQAPAVSPASPGFQNAQSVNNSIQFQRQRELLSSLLKQQHPMNPPNLLQPVAQQQRRCPSAKDVPIQQTLTLPTLGISPRQSPLPNDAMAMNSQGRIPSPLVFGQQPPALSHAPAPIHPAALAQAMNSVSPNTLQVQNPVVLQRVPSPQELAVHTQSILQNALIKRKLEEQKENFRKRQEAQRTSSPVPPNKNGMSTSPLKGLSPTIAFTPTSVMRKIQSEKTENKEQKVQQQNGTNDMRMPDSFHKQNSMPNSSNPIDASSFNSSNNMFSNSQQNMPRAVHGPARPIMSGMNSVGQPMQMPGQGRPIVKVGMGQSVNAGADLGRPAMPTSKAIVTHNKQFMAGNSQVHDMDPAAYTWQSQMSRQQALPQQLQMAATYAALNRPQMNHPHNMMRPMAPNAQPPTAPSSFPLMRNAPVQNPIRAQTGSMNPQLNHQLNQLAALQMQRGAMDSRQLQALAQSQRIHPSALQHILMNAQNPVAAAQAQVGFPGNRDGKHLLPGQPGNKRQSPVNLAKWFGNDVLKQEMPQMPPPIPQKAVLVEEIERQQQSVHN